MFCYLYRNVTAFQQTQKSTSYANINIISGCLHIVVILLSRNIKQAIYKNIKWFLVPVYNIYYSYVTRPSTNISGVQQEKTKIPFCFLLSTSHGNTKSSTRTAVERNTLLLSPKHKKSGYAEHQMLSGSCPYNVAAFNKCNAKKKRGECNSI